MRSIPHRDAYLAAGSPALAEKSYRRVAEGPCQDLDYMELPLSWLGMGRALAAEGNRDAAIDAYEHFLAVGLTPIQTHFIFARLRGK